MIRYKPIKDICFDDILLIPQQSDIKSRKDVDISMAGFDFPIVASPMDTVTESEMTIAIADQGGLGFIHRYMSVEDRIKQLKHALDTTKNKSGVGVAVSVVEVMDTDFVKTASDLGCIWFCIDTANGHNRSAISAVTTIKDSFPNVKVMVGNIATGEGFVELSNAGADAIRVGIGGGATCKTRIVTGHGVPTLQAVMDCYEYKSAMNLKALIVADGGIRNSGDVVKSFAAGADLVMLGSMIAGTDKSPGQIFNGYKKFRGMASSEAQMDWRGSVSVEEGVSTLIKYKGEVSNIFYEIKSGIQSGCSYSGVTNLSKLAEVALYNEVSTLSIQESIPHVGGNNA